MINDIKRSINRTIYERTSSPFYGSLIISWIICNWKIFYLTFFISENKIKINKIDYITSNYSKIDNIIYFPLISSLALMTIIPLISNGAYWLSLKFNKWKVDQKNIIDKKTLLSIEESIELRKMVLGQEENFKNLLQEKNNEIENLNKLIDRINESKSKRNQSF